MPISVHGRARRGRPSRGTNVLADYLTYPRLHPPMRALVRAALARGLSMRQLAQIVDRDATALSRSILAHNPTSTTIIAIAKALGFSPIVGRALAGALTGEDEAQMRERAVLDTLGGQAFGGAHERIRALLSVALKPEEKSAAADRRAALARYTLGEAGLLPDETAGSPLPPGLAALAAELRRRDQDVGVVASPPIDREDLLLAQVGISMIQRALGLHRADIVALRSLLESRGAAFPTPIESAVIVINTARDKAEAAARPVLEQPLGAGLAFEPRERPLLRTRRAKKGPSK